MRITDFEIVDHGIEHSQYFQGCGTSFTEFDHVATGIGNNPAEAYDDACEMIAQQHSGDCVGPEFDARVLADIGRKAWPKRPIARGDECYYLLSIRYNVAE